LQADLPGLGFDLHPNPSPSPNKPVGAGASPFCKPKSELSILSVVLEWQEPPRSASALEAMSSSNSGMSSERVHTGERRLFPASLWMLSLSSVDEREDEGGAVPGTWKI
jgi:hypothetical protein